MDNGTIYTRTFGRAVRFCYEHKCANGNRHVAGGFDTGEEAESALNKHKEKCER